MAVTFVGNALGGTTTTTSFSITLPATQAGDIIILEFTHRNTGDGTIGGTYTGPTFVQKHSQLYSASSFSGKLLWSRATGNHSGETVTGSGLTNSCAAIITIYRGCLASGAPLNDATLVGEMNASANETQAEITTNTDGAWVVLTVCTSPDQAITSQSCTSPGALTVRAERLSTGGMDTSIAHASAEKATAGATGAFTWSQTDQASGSWAYAIRPAGTLNTVSPNVSATGTATLQKQVNLDLTFSGIGSSVRQLLISVEKAYSGIGTLSAQKQINLTDKLYSAVGTVSLVAQFNAFVTKTYSATGLVSFSGLFIPGGGASPENVFQAIRRMLGWMGRR